MTLGTHRFWRARVIALDAYHRALEGAFPPPLALVREASDETIVCRCEGVTAGALRAAARALGTGEIGQVSAQTRVAMGRCEGRYCAIAAAEILAQTLDLTVEAVGRLAGPAPTPDV